MTTFKNGTFILLSLGGKEVIGQTSSTVSLAADMIETTSKTSDAGWKSFMAGDKSGTISCDIRYEIKDGGSLGDWGSDSHKAAIEAYNSGAVLPFELNDKSGGTPAFICSGNAIINDLPLVAPMNDQPVLSLSLQITGKVVFTEAESQAVKISKKYPKQSFEQ